jgi:hypothetical protein
MNNEKNMCCDRCGRNVHKTMHLRIEHENVYGLHVICRECLFIAVLELERKRRKKSNFFMFFLGNISKCIDGLFKLFVVVMLVWGAIYFSMRINAWKEAGTEIVDRGKWLAMEIMMEGSRQLLLGAQTLNSTAD